MISLVSTIYNDVAGLKSFFQAMAEQSHFPNEIIIVDAASNDGTWELMQAEAGRTDRPWKFLALQEARCNIARGRNLAIAAAAGDIIVSTDIGCDWDPEWLEELVVPLEFDSLIDLVIGSWAVRFDDLKGSWALTEWALKDDQRLEATANSYSSSRSIAYRKVVWEALGRYPEDLTFAGDDAVFHYLIELAGVRRVGASKVRCYWHRHESLKAFLNEAFRYGIGEGEAAIRAKDLMLIGGRLVLEAAGLLLGLIFLCPMLPFTPWLGIVFLSIAALSVIAKVHKMRKAIVRLKEVGVYNPVLRLLTFTYSTKWHWVKGHFVGSLYGRKHCIECRHRLRKMTPSFYRDKLAL